jgi:hypothetical protein
MSITSMLQRYLRAKLITEQGQLSKIGDRIATEGYGVCEVKADMSDAEIVKKLIQSARKAGKGRIVTLRPVDIHEGCSEGKKLAVVCVGFI